MTRKVLLALGLASALGLMAHAAVAHEGHDHGVKMKKIKKSKPKKTTIEFRLQHVAAGPTLKGSAASGAPRTKQAIVRRALTTR